MRHEFRRGVVLGFGVVALWIVWAALTSLALRALYAITQLWGAALFVDEHRVALQLAWMAVSAAIPTICLARHGRKRSMAGLLLVVGLTFVALLLFGLLIAIAIGSGMPKHY